MGQVVIRRQDVRDHLAPQLLHLIFLKNAVAVDVEFRRQVQVLRADHTVPVHIVPGQTRTHQLVSIADGSKIPVENLCTKNGSGLMCYSWFVEWEKVWGVRLVGEPGALVSLEQRGLRLVARPVDPAVRVRILLRPEAAHAPPEHPTSANSGQQKRSTRFDAVHGERGEEAHLGGCG